MGRFSRCQIGDNLLIFPRHQDLTIHANCLLICMKCQILFSGFLELYVNALVHILDTQVVKFLHADNENSDKTVWMHRLI